MAHNLSRARRRNAALALPIGQLSDWLVLSGCRSCRVKRYMRVAALAERYGGSHRLGDVLQRFRCRSCRGEPDTLQLLSGHEDSAGPLHGVILFGPGAF